MGRPAPAAAAAAPKHVETQGVALGERGKGRLPAAVFAQRLAVLIQEGRAISARAFVERYPDVAAEALKAAPPMAPDARGLVERSPDRRRPAVRGRRPALARRRRCGGTAR